MNQVLEKGIKQRRSSDETCCAGSTLDHYWNRERCVMVMEQIWEEQWFQWATRRLPGPTGQLATSSVALLRLGCIVQFPQPFIFAFSALIFHIRDSFCLSLTLVGVTNMANARGESTRWFPQWLTGLSPLDGTPEACLTDLGGPLRCPVHSSGEPLFRCSARK